MGKKRHANPEQTPSAPTDADDEYQGAVVAAAEGSHATQPLPGAVVPTTTFSEHTQVSPATPPPPNYGTATLHEYPNLTANAYSPQVNNFGHQHVGVDTTNVEGSNVPPPPTYNEAVHMPKYAPTAGQPPIGPPNYPQPGFVPISGQGYILQAPGQSASSSTAIGAPQPRVIHTATIIPPGRACVHCYTGTVTSETDLCCLLCLILFAILTFPIGLVLLCCVPCVVRKKCQRCRRLN